MPPILRGRDAPGITSPMNAAAGISFMRPSSFAAHAAAWCGLAAVTTGGFVGIHTLYAARADARPTELLHALHDNTGFAAVELADGVRLTQSFEAERDRLYAVRVQTVTSGRPQPHRVAWTLSRVSAGGGRSPVREGSVAAADAGEGTLLTVAFPPLAAVRGERLELAFAAPGTPVSESMGLLAFPSGIQSGDLRIDFDRPEAVQPLLPGMTAGVPQREFCLRTVLVYEPKGAGRGDR